MPLKTSAHSNTALPLDWISVHLQIRIIISAYAFITVSKYENWQITVTFMLATEVENMMKDLADNMKTGLCGFETI